MIYRQIRGEKIDEKHERKSIILGLVFAQIRKRKKHYHLLLGTLGKIFILKRM